MAEYPYIQSSDRLKKFMSHIQVAGVPEKLTTNYLLQIGFKSNNDRPLVKIMKHIGFCDSAGVPTERWQQYRDKSKAGLVLAEAVRNGYSNLFNTYPRAHQISDEDLKNYFGANTSVGAAALGHIVKTFRTLADLSNFSGDVANLQSSDASAASAMSQASRKDEPLLSTSTKAGGASVVINIRLEIPATDDPAVYESFFKSMNKHLLSS